MSLNYETVGSELLSQHFSRKQSSQDLIVNEDWVIVGKIVSYDASYGTCTFNKIWDLGGTPTVFYGVIKYLGFNGIPTASEVTTNAYTPFFRVGEFNSGGATAPELHTVNAGNYSWLGFVGKQS